MSFLSPAPVLPSLPPEGAQPLTTVYSYYLPEAREAAQRALTPLPHGLLLENLYPGLDELHQPLVDAYIDTFAGQVRGWETLPHRYPTAGSSEGLFHLMAAHAAEPDRLPLYQLDGEYQGYAAYAAALGLPMISLSADDLLTAPPGRVFISHPSALDGNLLDADLLAGVVDRHRVVLDLAYLGTTRPLDVDLDHENIDAVVVSFSKPFGLYYYRVGLCFSRRDLPSLYGNKWFKNALSLQVGTTLLNDVDVEKLRRRYAAKQLEAVRRASDALGVQLAPSDVWLLAHLPTGERPSAALEPFRRGDGYRVCLTAYLMQMEREERPHA